jgi:hypothetical protein
VGGLKELSVVSRPWSVAIRAVALLFLLGGVGWACNVPVFRYALEHWRPDLYRVTVLHRGELSAEQQALVTRIAEQQWTVPQGEGVAFHWNTNAVVRTVDVEQIVEDADRTLAEAIKDAPLPRMVLQYPAGLRLEAPVLTGALDDETMTGWLDSPARRELIHRLVEGETAVWVLLTTGDVAVDEPAAKLLDEELAALSRKLKLPELTESPEDVLLGSAPLKIEFSRLTVRRDDPAEQALVAMLLGCEPDLATTNEPMVFPVFGRCRVLLPLIGAGITADNLHTSAAFLTGACSCQVKNQNPGFDLLHAADWAGELLLDHDPAVAMSDATAKEPELVPIPSGEPAAPAPPATSAPVTTTTTVVPLPGLLAKVGVIVAVVVIAVLLFTTRR